MLKSFGESVLGSVGGGLFDAVLGGYSAHRQAKFARDEARKSRDWQERMSSTAHQRQAADMRKAGLNPILSATGGSGASSGGGAMAAMPESIASSIGAASSARAARAGIKLTEKQVDNAEETNELIKTQKVQTAASAKAQDNLAQLYHQQAIKSRLESMALKPEAFLNDRIANLFTVGNTFDRMSDQQLFAAWLAGQAFQTSGGIVSGAAKGVANILRRK